VAHGLTRSLLPHFVPGARPISSAIYGTVSVIAVVVIVLAAIVWQQRSSIEDHIHRHNCNMSFFGVHLDPPANLTRFCG